MPALVAVVAAPRNTRTPSGAAGIQSVATPHPSARLAVVPHSATRIEEVPTANSSRTDNSTPT